MALVVDGVVGLRGSDEGVDWVEIVGLLVLLSDAKNGLELAVAVVGVVIVVEGELSMVALVGGLGRLLLCSEGPSFVTGRFSPRRPLARAASGGQLLGGALIGPKVEPFEMVRTNADVFCADNKDDVVVEEEVDEVEGVGVLGGLFTDEVEGDTGPAVIMS